MPSFEMRMSQARCVHNPFQLNHPAVFSEEKNTRIAFATEVPVEFRQSGGSM